MAAPAGPVSWAVAIAPVVGEPVFVGVTFDESRHARVGDVAEAAAAKLGHPGEAQVRLALFLVKRAEEVGEDLPPTMEECNAALASREALIKNATSLRDPARRDATLPDGCWLVLKINMPAGGESRADARAVGCTAVAALPTIPFLFSLVA